MKSTRANRPSLLPVLLIAFVSNGRVWTNSYRPTVVGCLTACLAIIACGCGAQPKPAPETAVTDFENESSAGNQATPRHGQNAAVRSSIQFVDRATSAGVVFNYDHGGAAGHASILESVGGGCGLIDFDGDHDLDLFFLGGGKFSPDRKIFGLPSALYRNQGTWNFQSVTAPARVDAVRHYTHGTTMADFDQDGFEDILVTGYGGVQFWHNLGDGSFQDITLAAQLTDSLWSTSAAWGDFNGDGDLDLFVTHYVDWSFQNDPFCPSPDPNVREICSPKVFGPLRDLLYFSIGDGTFQEASDRAGLRKESKGLGVLAADFDLDGKLDVYVANDTAPNFLYHNIGQGRFEEIGDLSGSSLGDNSSPDGSMGIAVGDFNLDGLPDIWVANFENESFALYRNDGNCTFLHVSQPLGVTAAGSQFVGFGTVFFDVDRDGDEDLWVSNGHVLLYPVNAPVKQLPLLFENQGGKWFQNIAPFAGQYCTTPHLGRGVAKGDLDGDGDLDLVTTHMLEPQSLLENTSQNANGWFQTRLIGTRSNRSAIGALLTLRTSTGVQIRQISGGGSYLSHSDSRAFWGISAGTKVEELTVRWPSGVKQVITHPQPNSILTVIEPYSNAGEPSHP
ncbi:MAG: UnbV [Planctomycetaceae bacterium]|nr:UnbV [Planctomycetaceae bacterium]